MATKEHQREVTQRFLQAMRTIVAEQNMKNTSEFADKVDEYQQNFSKMERGDRYATMDSCCLLCLEYGISAEWLFLGHGEMRTDKTLETRISDLEKQMKELTKKSKSLKKPVKSRL